MTMGMPVQLLAQVPYFAGLDQAQLLALARTAVPRRYETGQIVLLEGEPCTGMHIVESGWLRSLKSSPSGREQTLRVVGPGEVFGDFTMFAASAECVECRSARTGAGLVHPRRSRAGAARAAIFRQARGSNVGRPRAAITFVGRGPVAAHGHGPAGAAACRERQRGCCPQAAVGDAG